MKSPQCVYNIRMHESLKAHALLKHLLTEIVISSKTVEPIICNYLMLKLRLFPVQNALATHGHMTCQQDKGSNQQSQMQFLALDGFLDHSSPLSSREVFETCVIPTLLYGAENWILNEGCLEHFQAEIGRILTFQVPLETISANRPLLAICNCKSTDSQDHLPTSPAFILGRIYCHLHLQNLGKPECIWHHSCQALHIPWLKIQNCTAQILGGVNDTSSCITELKDYIISIDHQLILEKAREHQSVTVTSDIRLGVWEAARDKGPYWTNIIHSIYKLLTRPLFRDRVCKECDSVIQDQYQSSDPIPCPPNSRHICLTHRSPSQDSEPVTAYFHCMKFLVSLTLQYKRQTSKTQVYRRL